MFASGSKGEQTVNRGDTTNPDWNAGTLTMDGNWNDLDLSSIVPAGAKSVTLIIMYMATSAANTLQIRTKGFAQAGNIQALKVPVIAQAGYVQRTVYPDSDGVIEYKATVANWITLDVTVNAWRK